MKTFTTLSGPGRRPHRLAAALLLAGLLTTLAGQAQVANYTFSQSTGTYTPLSTTSSTLIVQGTLLARLAGRPTRLAPGAIPFPFTFNGQAYTTCYVHGSGYLTFGTTRPLYDTINVSAPPWWFNPISEPTGYDGAVAPLATPWNNGATQSGPWSDLRYEVQGTAPNRTFVVQWNNMYDDNAGGPFNFQVHLHETSNAIDFVYGYCRAQFNGQAQVGLRGTTNTDFINRTGPWNNHAAGTTNLDRMLLRVNNNPASGLTFTFAPPAPPACPPPFSLRADSLGPASAYLNWRVNGGTGPFSILYGPAGFNPATPGAGTTLPVPAGQLGLRVSGLSVYTAYDFYVTQTCGGTAGSSTRSPVASFRTTLANDDPPVAQVLPIGPTCQPVPGTNVGANQTPANGYAYLTPNACNISSLPHDVWYQFTTAATGPASRLVRLTTAGSGAAIMTLFSSAGGGAGPFTPLACSQAGVNAPEITYGNLLPSTTYYVAVADGLNPGSFTICATLPPGCGAPLNPTVVTLSPTTARLDFTPSTGNPADYTLTLTPDGGSTSTLTPAPTSAPVALSGLLPGTRYTLTLQANCGGTLGASPVQTRVFITPAANDEPAGAIALPLLPTCQPVAGTTIGARSSTPATPPLTSLCTSGPTRPDVWYSFTTDATGPGSMGARVEVVAGNLGAFVVLVGSSPNGAAGPFTSLGCTPDTRTSPGIDLSQLTPSTTYYIRVWEFISSAGNAFTICVRHPRAPVTCAAPASLAVSNLTPSSATVSWLIPAPFPTPQRYEVTYRAPNGTAVPLTPAVTASPAVLTGLLPGTRYTVVVRADCGPAGRGLADSLSFRTPGPPPNDLCAGATALACGQSRAGSALGATRGGQPTGACQGRVPGSAGVWYVVQGTGQTMTLRTCLPVVPSPPYMGTELSVYGGSCAALSCVAASGTATSCSYPDLAEVSFAALAGQPYYVLVSNPNGITRDFVLSASCGPLAVRAAGLAAQVQLYPNPAHHAATLTLPAGLRRPAGGVTLSNALGQVVREYPAPGSAGSTELDLTGLAAGVYTLRLTTAQGPVSKRLLVE